MSGYDSPRAGGMDARNLSPLSPAIIGSAGKHDDKNRHHHGVESSHIFEIFQDRPPPAAGATRFLPPPRDM